MIVRSFPETDEKTHKKTLHLWRSFEQCVSIVIVPKNDTQSIARNTVVLTFKKDFGIASKFDGYTELCDKI